MRKRSKKLNAKLSASFNSRDQWCIEVRDDDSNLVVVEVIVEKDEFFHLMSSLGGRPATALVYPNFETLGKRSEHQGFSMDVTDEMRQRLFPQPYSINKVELNKFIDELNEKALVEHNDGVVGPWIISHVGECTRYGNDKVLHLNRVRYSSPVEVEG